MITTSGTRDVLKAAVVDFQTLLTERIGTQYGDVVGIEINHRLIVINS